MRYDESLQLPIEGEETVQDSEQIRHWRDRRLIETYRRLSRDLRRRGFERRTAHLMGCVEEGLRDRDIDPERIVRNRWYR